MNKGLLAVLILLAAVAGVVLVPRLFRGPEPPARTVERAEPADVRLTCVHCRATFSSRDAGIHPENPSMVICPKCGKPTPRRPARPAR